MYRFSNPRDAYGRVILFVRVDVLAWHLIDVAWRLKFWRTFTFYLLTDMLSRRLVWTVWNYISNGSFLNKKHGNTLMILQTAS